MALNCYLNDIVFIHFLKSCLKITDRINQVKKCHPMYKKNGILYRYLYLLLTIEMFDTLFTTKILV